MKKNNVFIIAEAGINHNGSLKKALKLVDAALGSGADAIKFQTFKSESVISKNAPKAEYQKQNLKTNETQLEMAKRLELDDNSFKIIKDYCEKNKIEFFSTAFDKNSLKMLMGLGQRIIKVPSGEITNLPFLEKIGSYNKKLIMSTGMCQLTEVEEALNILINSGTSKEKITILHCNTEYPTPPSDVNLKAMITIQNKFDIAVGYSDHTLGIEIPIAAVALGASIIEKHLTLDKKLPGPDHTASLEPKEFKAMVDAIRLTEISLGDGIKQPSKSEIKNISIARRSIVAKKDIKSGEKFTESNLSVKRPGSGISPMEWKKMIGQKAKHNFKPDDLIKN